MTRPHLLLCTLGALAPAIATAAPSTGPDGTCDPDEEALALCFTTSGGYVVEAVPDATGAFPMIDAEGNSQFSYLVTGPGVGGSCQGTMAISHLDLVLPVCPETPLAIDSSIPAGELLDGGHGDPSCGYGTGDPTIEIFKWEVGVPCDGATLFTLILQGRVDAAPTDFLIKAGTACEVATILGPTCTEPCAGAIGDFVWLDENGDGVQDPGEPGVEGVTLLLINEGGLQVDQAVTGPDGQYSFEQVCPGTYTVTIDTATVPAGLTPSPCMVGTDPAVDSDCSPATVVVTMETPAVPTIDFGYTPNPLVYCESTDNSTGGPADIEGTGSLSISDNDFTISISGLPVDQPGYIFYGTEQNDIPFGNGVRCIGGTVVRYRKVVMTQGAADVELDFTVPPLTNIAPGIPYYFQFWYRDPAAGGAGFNTSDALCVIFAP